ncbi:hypothetical protein [Salinicoccus roseus]|uniref:hypothetical protein n=1 Tax=Salinicoccus roseus TaxID=45670 RepID=UPI003DA015FF
MKRDVISIIIILLLGGLLFHFSTDGFRIYTIEAERVESLKNEKPDFPKVDVVDNKGRAYPFTMVRQQAFEQQQDLLVRRTEDFVLETLLQIDNQLSECPEHLDRYFRMIHQQLLEVILFDGDQLRRLYSNRVRRV